MRPILLLIVLEALACQFARSLFPDTYVTTLLLINSVLFLYYLLRQAETTPLFLVFITAFFVRLVLMFIDLELFRLPPHSGDDTEAFHLEGVQIFTDPSTFNDVVRGTYSKFLGIFYLMFGPERILAQFLNVILGVVAVVILAKTLQRLRLPERYVFAATLIFAFFPQGLLLSPILLRDQIVALGIVYTLYYMVRWTEEKSGWYMTLAYLGYFVSTMFHSGLAVGIIVLLVYFSFYSHETRRMDFEPTKVQRLIFQVLIVGFIVYSFQDVLFAKFTHVSENGQLFSGMSYDRGGSAYLNGLTVTGPADMILYSPIRTIYFLFSPFPWQWSSVMNILIFFLDAIFYFIACFAIVRSFKLIRQHPFGSVLFFFFLLFALNAVIFGLGTGNVGTAIRHRYKLFPMLLIVYTSVHYMRWQARHYFEEVEHRAE
ncbi:glycosyltransferase family 39 protein [Exiguobacterium indicum]|uniref:glycosyltransferase family 39 protein n=1 Tax=Exiguobacterium indicum TaxID=296995 RepID=UPI002B258BC7|nr:glycosyltransferase family 39 protein [Exiguobacterium indicum]